MSLSSSIRHGDTAVSQQIILQLLSLSSIKTSRYSCMTKKYYVQLWLSLISSDWLSSSIRHRDTAMCQKIILQLMIVFWVVARHGDIATWQKNTTI